MQPKALKVDWQTIALNLRSSEHNLTRVAQKIGCDPATLSRIARGETPEPKFSVGVALLNLHYDLLPDKHSKLQQQHKL